MYEALTHKVQAMAPGEFWFVIVLLGAASLFLFYYIWRSLHRARIIEDTPTARIRSAQQGYVELEGEGELSANNPTTAPLSHQACLWYRFQIEHREVRYTSKGQQTHWRTLHQGVSDATFTLCDETGCCLVDPAGAEVTPSEEDVWYGHSEWPAAIESGASRGWLRSGDYRYTEARLMRGAVYALGHFKTQSGSASVKERTAELLREWKPHREQLLERFDSDHSGEIELSEWERVREAAAQEALREQLTSRGDAETHMLVDPDDRRLPFLLSAYPQQRLASRYRRNAMLSLFGSFATLIALLVMVTVRGG